MQQKSANKIEKILAVDLGGARTGLAISKFNVCLPHSTIYATNIKGIALEVKKIAEMEGVNLIVIGNPKNADDTESKTSIRVKEFLNILKRNVKIHVVLHDEFMTTKEALSNLKESCVNFKKKRVFVDQEAARLILESYLSSKGISDE